PEACRTTAGEDTATSSHRPASSAARCSATPGESIAQPCGRQCTQTVPPDATWNARCGPTAPQRTQQCSTGAQPEADMDRRRNASATSPGGRRCCERERRAPTARTNSRGVGAPSSPASRSAVSRTTHPEVYEG